MSMHEDFDREGTVKRGSDRSFGVVFAIVFAIVGLWPLSGGAEPRWWALAMALAFALAAAAVPRRLAPLNRLWHRFGLLLNRVATTSIPISPPTRSMQLVATSVG